VDCNPSALELFGRASSEIGTITLWDVVAHVDWNEINVPGKGTSIIATRGDSSVGLMTFRRSDETKFMAWVYAVGITDEDGIVRHRASVILSEIVNLSYESLGKQIAQLINRNIFADAVVNSAHEINNSLMSLQANFEKLALPETDREVINRAFSRLKDAGDFLAKLGDKSRIEPSPTVEQSELQSDVLESKLKILIVENEPDLLTILTTFLETAGFVVTTGSNLEEGQARCESEQFDFALLDIELGDGVGTTLAERLLKDSPTTKTILMTGFSRHVQKYENHPDLEFLRKPFSVFQLLELIQSRVK
jgi:CheY-like chemotaxis protein